MFLSRAILINGILNQTLWMCLIIIWFFSLHSKGTSLLIIHVPTIGNALEPSSQILVNRVCVHVNQDTCPLTTTVIKVNKLVSIIFNNSSIQYWKTLSNGEQNWSSVNKSWDRADPGQIQRADTDTGITKQSFGISS